MENAVSEIEKLIETNATEMQDKLQRISSINVEIVYHKGKATGLDEALTILKKGGD